ncbi:MAG: DUF2225 domain-containing protein, partial [Bacillota bacterium]
MDNNNSLYKLFQKYGDVKELKAGENLFNYKTPAKNIYFILNGKINLFIKDGNGEEKQVACLNSGDILGEKALLDSTKHGSKATVEEDVNLLEFSPANFKKVMAKQISFSEKVVLNLAKRIQVLQNPDSLKTKNSKELSKEIEKEKLKNKDIDEIDYFYLEGHSIYSKKAEEKFEHYLYSKEIECPVCSTKFEVKKIRNSRLKLKKIREDLRPIYKDFEPHWYKVWTCPNCFYTAPKKSFFDLRKKEKKKIKGNFKDKIKEILGEDYKPSYSDLRTINEVFDAYYLAIKLLDFIKGNKNDYAYLWLRISWLYEEIEENRLADKASKKAMEHLSEFYFEDNSANLSNTQKNKLILLLANLFYKHDKSKEALPLLNDLIHNNQSKKIHRRKARDLFM